MLKFSASRVKISPCTRVQNHVSTHSDVSVFHYVKLKPSQCLYTTSRASKNELALGQLLPIELFMSHYVSPKKECERFLFVRWQGQLLSKLFFRDILSMICHIDCKYSSINIYQRRKQSAKYQHLAIVHLRLSFLFSPLKKVKLVKNHKDCPTIYH